jgi:hypothetical protein
MALNFGEWVVRMAVEGVKTGSFNKEWAALQLANYYTKGKITEEDISRFDTEVSEYEKMLEAENILASEIRELEDE